MPPDAALAPVPIVMVSAVDTELDVVLGLELGRGGLRDQAVPAARAGRPDAGHPATRVPPGRRPSSRPSHAILGRTARPGRRPDAPVAASARVPGGLRTPGGHRRTGVHTHLSRREFDLLAVLLSPPRRVRTRNELIDLLWPDRYLSDSRTLDTRVHRLRAKLEPDPAQPRFIVTVRGVGFRSTPTAPPVAGPPVPITRRPTHTTVARRA